MATRFYFPATNYPYPPSLNVNTTPSYSGSWTLPPFPLPGRSPSVFFTPNGTSGSYDNQGTALINPTYALIEQYVSEPIPANTFSNAQTWSGQFLCAHTQGGLGVMTGACIIRLLSNDCSVVRGTLISWLPTTIGTPPSATQGTDWAASDTNRQLPANGLPSANLTGYNGDRLVFEVGFTLLTAAAGHRGQLDFNASGTTDLSAGDQTDTDTSKNGWIEYSGNIFTGRTCRTRSTT